MPLNKAMEWFTTDTQEFPHTQIGMEIDYMREKYPGIRPAMLLCYENQMMTKSSLIEQDALETSYLNHSTLLKDLVALKVNTFQLKTQFVHLKQS